MAGVPANALLALTAAASWGGGDFSGGMGVKAAGSSTTAALRVVLVSHATSFAVLAAWLLFTHARLPHGALLWWGLGSGVTGCLSVAAFYMALARGAMGASAAISGVLAAAIPAAVSTLTEGAPGLLRLAGFAVALAAIWTIAAGDSPENTPDADPRHARVTLALAICGGLGFGLYFVALRMDNALGVALPMALARSASLVTCVLLLAVFSPRTNTHTNRVPHVSILRRGFPATPWLTREALFWAMGVALLDTGGNMLFVAATRLGRLDVAAVLASLYPASTILLAAWRLHEKPTQRQRLGMLVALAAVVMITL